jgi:hypothetical protein
MVLQDMAPPKWITSMLKSEAERITSYHSQVDFVRAREAESLQSRITCKPVHLRLPIEAKALKAAIQVGTIQRRILQHPSTVEFVTEGELKIWLIKPER